MQPWIQYLEESEEETPILQIPMFNRVVQADWEDLRVFYDFKILESDNVFVLERESINASTNKSLELARTGGDYSTPSGKTSQAFVILRSNSAALTFKVRSSASADTADGTVVWDQTAGMATTELVTVGPVDIAATQFVTIEFPASQSGFVLQAVIIEPA